MRIVQGLDAFPPDPRPAAIALGVFDGVHLGHRAILGRAVADARQEGLDAVACTFDRHPLETLQPARAPVPIATLQDRLRLIGECGLDAVVVLPFTRELASVEPEAFVKEILLDRLRARRVVVGYNHTFGRGARGDARLLEALADRLGFRADVIPPLLVDGVPVSSTEIRAALGQGDVRRAARYLGREYTVPGTVVAGAGRGRQLGFPTANLATDLPLLLPPGVYACRAALDGRDHPAVTNVGVRPTFGETALAVEVHVLDFAGDLYGKAMRLTFVDRLREERKFPGIDALKAQIAADVAEVRRRL
ncbi:MAG: bifunctional riboflavin kinase/FAD synthetase [Candidatus Rokubacteria bacterium]|nr:bifunctional riboflavin kinase/FAD synthetase [Candidatus Rokubacteria bacterium]MBI3827216.1 bifunctional riboflavin kinase/FAD synthetase [Candidatus Rokubacteria bacterium]